MFLRDMGKKGYLKFQTEFTLKKFEERMVGILELCVGKKG